jgi:hypothetical protein
MTSDNSHEKDRKKAPMSGALSRRGMLLTGTSALATAGLLSAAQIAPAQALSNGCNRERGECLRHRADKRGAVEMASKSSNSRV